MNVITHTSHDPAIQHGDCLICFPDRPGHRSVGLVPAWHGTTRLEDCSMCNPEPPTHRVEDGVYIASEPERRHP